jgi:hypothetical protein
MDLYRLHTNFDEYINFFFLIGIIKNTQPCMPNTYLWVRNHFSSP